MRLYCPTCRQVYDESEERYASTDGKIPCRVCYTIMTTQEANGDFNEELATQAIAAVPAPAPAPAPAASEDEGIATTALDASMLAQIGAGPPAQPLQPPPPAQPAAPPLQPPPPAQPAAPPYLEPPPAQPAAPPYLEPPPAQPVREEPKRSSFGGANTYIFPKKPLQEQRTGNFAVPVEKPSYKPTTEPVPEITGDGRPKRKRKLVLGGAAAGSAESMTQVYDVSVLADLASSAAPAAPAPKAPPPQPPPMQQQMVVGSPAPAGSEVDTAHGRQPVRLPQPGQGPPAAARRRSRLPLFLALFLLVAGGIAAVLFLVVFKDGDEGASGETTDVASVPASAPRADELLRNVAFQVVPVSVTGGESAATHAVVVAALVHADGSRVFWVSTPQAPEPIQADADLLSAIPEGDLPVFVLFDQSSESSAVVQTVQALSASQHSPWLAGGSVMGDGFFAFPVDASGATPITVQITEHSIRLNRDSWPEPRTFCYTGLLPTDDLTLVFDDAVLGLSNPINVQIQTAAGIPMQTLLTLIASLHRSGVHHQLTMLQTPEIPEECAQ